jgi:hypothetical protein
MWIYLRILAARNARVMHAVLALFSEGAGNAGRQVRPPPRVRESKVKSTRVSQVTPETPGIPHAMVLRFPSCSPRRSGSFATVASRTLPRNLTPASRRQDHTTSPSASGTLVRSAIRVHRIPPHVRDDRETPLWEAGRGNQYSCFYRSVNQNSEIQNLCVGRSPTSGPPPMLGVCRHIPNRRNRGTG